LRRSWFAETLIAGVNTAPGAIEEITRLIAAGQPRVPVGATPVEQIRAVGRASSGRHVHGKVVIDHEVA
jgi:hypothetical protein